jgi:hypothetical protein
MGWRDHGEKTGPEEYRITLPVGASLTFKGITGEPALPVLLKDARA